MIKVSVLYPNSDSARFDIDYYCDKHMPMVKKRVGGALKSLAVDHGLSGGAPGSKPDYIAMGHLFFDSVEAFQSAFGPHSKEIMADIPNYTNTKPQVLISEVKI